MKVNANTLRQGHVIEYEGKLYAILTAQNIQPGKGTPVTQVDMRRLSDGVKVTERFRTTESVERAYIEEAEFQYLYSDGDGHTFMNQENFDQIQVASEVIGDQAVYLQENMVVTMRLHEGVPVSIELPQRVTLEIVETEPTVKGQTASSSYKPAKLANGVRIMVPPHISAGTKVVVNTADGTYLERARD